MELIDIKLDQINEWLVLRRKLDKAWSRHLKPIDSRQYLSLSKLSDSKEFASVIPESMQGYLQARTIFESLLKTSELEKGKTMFGNYSSEFLYEWESILKLYERNQLHIADCAKNLLQVGLYEVPSIKSSLSSLEKQIKEMQHKETEINEEIVKKNKAFKEKCKGHGIEGENVQYELKMTTRRIPEGYLDVIKILQGENLTRIINTYERVTLQNHGCAIDLPVLKSLREFALNAEIDTIKNKYCSVISNDEPIGDVELLDENNEEWVIEMIEEGTVVKIEQYDIPLENKQIRTDLITELVELQSFTETNGGEIESIKAIYAIFNGLREPILIFEQNEYLERLVKEFDRVKKHNLFDKLIECQKLQEGLKQSIKATHEKLCEQLQFAAKLIAYIETSVNQLFPNISVKVVGDVVKDIKHFL
jgi:hypothetical protein